METSNGYMIFYYTLSCLNLNYNQCTNQIYEKMLSTCVTDGLTLGLTAVGSMVAGILMTLVIVFLCKRYGKVNMYKIH